MKLILWLALLPVGAFAYDFPYHDPYLATVTAAILKADHLDKETRYEDLKLRVLPERDSVPFYGRKRNHLRLRLWAQKSRAPLVVMVSGLGAPAASSYYNYLGYQLHRRGFHVLSIPSPFHWSFALAASRSGYPGITRRDAEDLHLAILSALELLKGRRLESGRVGLLGVSMGGLEAAYLSQIDARENKIGFNRILLVNPPVDPVASSRRLDALAAEGASFSQEQKKNLQENVWLFGIKAMAMSDIKSPDYFLRVEEELPTTLPERKFLIGKSLGEFLEALIFTTQQVRDLGILRNPIATDKADARLNESRGFRYFDYMERFLLPALGTTFEQEIQNVNMNGVEAHLRADGRVFLMHNQDDFIMGEGELAYLQGIFGERMRLYPRGGHMGNLWFPENLEALIGTFEAMK